MVDEYAEEVFANSKIRDEDGKLLKVYHGTDADFTVFDKTKGRSSMDIQGMFFSPWDIDARGYGPNVRAFYLNITNPANESTGYRQLKKYKGQYYAGTKAREDLENIGYDGVNNEEEEFIAFNPEQIKSADPVTYDDDGNIIPLSERFDSNEVDIRYSLAETEDIVQVNNSRRYYKALSREEWAKFTHLITTGLDTGLRISDNAVIVECEENSEYQYKLLIYDNEIQDNPIKSIYAIGNIDYNITTGNEIGYFINELENKEYDSKKIFKKLLRNHTKMFGYLLRQYNIKSKRYIDIGTKLAKNGKYFTNQSNGTGVSADIEQGISDEKLRQDILLFISMIYRYCDMIYS